MNQKQKGGWSFRINKVDGSSSSRGIYSYTRPVRIRSKGRTFAGHSHLGDKEKNTRMLNPIAMRFSANLVVKM
jgi:hypothetical protein